MANGLELVLHRVERAKEQRRDLEIEMRRWGSDAYKVGSKPDLQTGYTVYYVGEMKEPSLLMLSLIGEILHTLRTTFDHLAYQLFLVGRTDPTDDGSKIDFPIYDDTKTTEAKAFRQIKSFRVEIIEAIRQINPCKSGHPPLWILHRLDNVHKHRRILTSMLVHHSVFVRDAMKQLLIEKGFGDMLSVLELRPDFFTARRGEKAQLGDIVFSTPPGTSEEMKNKLKFTFDVAFDEPGILEGKSVIETLDELIKMAEAIVLSFKPFLA